MDYTHSSGLSPGKLEVEYVSLGLRCGHDPGDLQLRLRCLNNTDCRNASPPEDSVAVLLQIN